MPGWLKSNAEMEDENRLLNGTAAVHCHRLRRHSASLLVKPWEYQPFPSSAWSKPDILYYNTPSNMVESSLIQFDPVWSHISKLCAVRVHRVHVWISPSKRWRGRSHSSYWAVHSQRFGWVSGLAVQISIYESGLSNNFNNFKPLFLTFFENMT